MTEQEFNTLKPGDTMPPAPHPLQRLATDALQVLNACNPSGVFRSAHEAASILSAHCNGTAEVSAHPILKMHMCLLMQLTGCGLMDPEVFHVAYEAVKELAMKETQP